MFLGFGGFQGGNQGEKKFKNYHWCFKKSELMIVMPKGVRIKQ